MNYYNELAMHLRGRRLPESQVASILADVAEATRASGRDPGEEFGTAKEYAEQFPQGRARPAGWWAVRILGLMVGASAAVYSTLSVARDEVNPYLFGLPAWAYPVAILVALLIVGTTLDTRLPRGFRSPSGR